MGWHQATRRGARLPRKAGRELCPRRGPGENKHRLNAQRASIPKQGAFLEVSSFHNKILRKAWISLNNPGGNRGSEKFNDWPARGGVKVRIQVCLNLGFSPIVEKLLTTSCCLGKGVQQWGLSAPSPVPNEPAALPHRSTVASDGPRRHKGEKRKKTQEDEEMQGKRQKKSQWGEPAAERGRRRGGC